MRGSVHACGARRNSKLTMLLQDSLGGDAKALMIANLAPSPAHAQETLSSLAFAAKARPAPPRLNPCTQKGSASQTPHPWRHEGRRPRLQNNALPGLPANFLSCPPQHP